MGTENFPDVLRDTVNRCLPQHILQPDVRPIGREEESNNGGHG